MNIEISNEQIEQMIEKAVNERVKVWFDSPENKYFIGDAIIKAVDVEVSKRLVEKIIDNIGHNIAAIFAEKYDY